MPCSILRPSSSRSKHARVPHWDYSHMTRHGGKSTEQRSRVWPRAPLGRPDHQMITDVQQYATQWRVNITDTCSNNVMISEQMSRRQSVKKLFFCICLENISFNLPCHTSHRNRNVFIHRTLIDITHMKLQTRRVHSWAPSGSCVHVLRYGDNFMSRISSDFYNGFAAPVIKA